MLTCTQYTAKSLANLGGVERCCAMRSSEPTALKYEGAGKAPHLGQRSRNRIRPMTSLHLGRHVAKNCNNGNQDAVIGSALPTTRPRMSVWLREKLDEWYI